MTKQLRVVTFVGTRPEVIRLSSTIKRLDATLDHKLVHTGQNYDYELNELIFKDLGLRQPDIFLNTDTSTLGTAIGSIIAETERVLNELRPDAVLVLGDTNSCLAGIMAKRMHIPLFHMEAGNRCFDENVPEETNRRIIDHIADFNLVYTEHARRNLLAEGIHPRRIYLTGSPMAEVLNEHRAAIGASSVLDDLGLQPSGYIVVSCHRQENVDSPERLNLVVETIQQLASEFSVPVLVSAHPRTRTRLSERNIGLVGDVRLHRPFGFLDYNSLQMQSLCVVSDSGTVSEEASILGFPAVTIRTSIERPEAMDTGAIVITGLDATNVINGVKASTNSPNTPQRGRAPSEYDITDASHRVARLIIGLAPLSAEWSGLRPVAGRVARGR